MRGSPGARLHTALSDIPVLPALSMRSQVRKYCEMLNKSNTSVSLTASGFLGICQDRNQANNFPARIQFSRRSKQLILNQSGACHLKRAQVTVKFMANQ